MTEQSSC